MTALFISPYEVEVAGQVLTAPKDLDVLPEHLLVAGDTYIGLKFAQICDEIVHSLLDVMAADVPYAVIQRCVHIHPTVSELIPTLLGTLVPLAAEAAK